MLSFPGPYHVAGNKILSANGNRFIPYGFVLECLAASHSVNLLCTKGSSLDSLSGVAQIQAARYYWHANAIRFQVSRCTLFDRSGYNHPYLNLVDKLVNETNEVGMVAIVTLQEEECDAKTKPLPDATSVNFWRLVAAHFRHSPNVMFDLFNEPRLPVAGSITEGDVWSIWRNGGRVDSGGVDDTFVGMQALVSEIRSVGANNIIIVESNKSDTDMSELSTHYLTGPNIAYGVEPNLGRHDRTRAEWSAHFGRYANVVPVLTEAFLDNVGKRNCNPNSPTLVPQLFNYLQSKGMGVLAWTLESGLYNVGSNLERPTSYQASKVISCPSTNVIDRSNTVGAGRDLLSFFAAHSPYSK